MAVLGSERIRERIAEGGLIANLNSRDQKRMEGAGVDLSVGKVFRIVKGSNIGITTRTRPQLELLAEYEKGKRKKFIIKPGESYVVQTVEKVKMPKDLTASISPRHSLYGQAVLLGAGNVAPGYEGELSFAVFNASPENLSFSLGARLFFIEFRLVEGGVNTYAGQWQHGNTVSVKNEKQI